MNAPTFSATGPIQENVAEKLDDLKHAVEHLAHLLPSQAPIQVFVHHNTLHAFEDQAFHDAVTQGAAIYGCHAYLPEERYREKLANGRIQPQDLAAVLMEDLGDEADRLIGFLTTRYSLRLAMLQYRLRFGGDAEIHWVIAEGGALERFCAETPIHVRDQMIDRTRRWVMRDLRNGNQEGYQDIRKATAVLFDRFGASTVEQWENSTWEAFTLHLLWQVCRSGVHGVRQFVPTPAPSIRHRDCLLEATGVDTDRYVNEVLIRFCAAFLDQGVAVWQLPTRERGFFNAFCDLYESSRPVEFWLRGLPAELKRIRSAGLSPLEMIDESLRLLGVTDREREEFLSPTLLALRGWAGMVWQMETNAEWTVRPAPAGTLLEYLAVRLILERLALTAFAGEALGEGCDLRELRQKLHKLIPHPPRVSVDQRAFTVFQVAQLLGWKPSDLYRLSKLEWSLLVEEIEAFSELERRRIYHLAFERRYRHWFLDALSVHSKYAAPMTERPRFQIICCLDEREESFRRHLEEIVPECETFGVAGFFGVAMYYRGISDAHFVPLCPIVIKPKHYVREEVAYAFEESHRRRSETRRVLGRASHSLHVGSRSGVAGALTALLGSFASIPLVARVLFPRLTARIRRLAGSFVQPPAITRLSMERVESTPGPQNGHLGYSLDETVDIARRVLQDAGLTRQFARLVLIAGHGSSSLNNPHRSAYDCGACGGGRGGPNARALAGILNDPRVRDRLAETGLKIPQDTVFVGAFHNTCEDSVEYADLNQLPSSHHDDFEHAKLGIEEARRRNAHERCRRFESAEFSFTPEAALRHVESRAEDLSQVRPECGHATNAVCLVGRRWRTRGLFLDRRAFLASYDPTQDDEQARVLERILQAAIPVCAGINLEYCFCYTDPYGYGCGTKLPHNITSLLGVMDGAASDLRSGLPWQMVEIHEPMRIIFLIETTPAALHQILERNPAVNRLVHNEWVQLATLDPHSSAIRVFRHGEFKAYQGESTRLPIVRSSVDWYRGWRDHLGFAVIRPNGVDDGDIE